MSEDRRRLILLARYPVDGQVKTRPGTEDLNPRSLFSFVQDAYGFFPICQPIFTLLIL